MLLDRSLTLPSLLLLLLLASDCHGYGAGAPAQACADVTPQHQTDPKPAAEFPYQLVVTPTRVQPGESVTLTINGRDSTVPPIEGFFVQARDAGNPEVPPALGQFVNIDSMHKAVDCDSPASGITHNSPDPKTTVSVTWKAPGALNSDVIFLVTVVQERAIFWAGMKSEIIALTDDGESGEPMEEPAAEPSPEPTAEPSPKPMAEVDDDAKKGSAGSVHAGAALLLAPLAMAAFLRLQ